MAESRFSFFRKNWNRQFIDRFLALIFILAACVYSMLDRDKMPVINIPVKGQTAETHLRAAFRFESKDLEKTEKINAEKLKRLPLFFKIDPDAEVRVSRYMEEFFKEAERRQTLEAQKMPYKKAETPGGILAAGLSAKALDVIAELYRNENRFKSLQSEILAMVKNGILPSGEKMIPLNKMVKIKDAKNRTHEQPIRYGSIKMIPVEAQRITDSILISYAKKDREKVFKGLCDAFEKILSTGQMTPDDDAKQSEEKKAVISPIKKVFNEGDILIPKNKKIGGFDVKLMEEYRDSATKRWEIRQKKKWQERIIQNTAIALLILLFCGIYLYHINPDLLSNVMAIRMMTLTTIVSIFFNMLASHAFEMLENQYSVPHNLLYIVLPLGFAPLVLSVTYGMRCALFSGLFITVIASLSTTDPFHVVLMGLMVSALASFSVRRVLNYRNFFIYAFLTISITTILLCMLVLWRNWTPESRISPWMFTLPFACGLLTAGASLIMVFILEAVFEVSTTMSLLLSSDYSHPLLRRLQMEAPGTYFHSHSVASLAEEAARRIGANPIKTRACALFHDVGKLSKPEYFTENSVGEDHHRDLPPEESANIIIDHVRKGVELAKKYKLRKLIRDAIQQHHGTDLVQSFYKKALDSGKEVHEKDFRYDGPTPALKEIALVMLADACEAASRSLQRPTKAQIEELVSRIIEKRLRSGQLDESNLTFRELRIIKESFVNTLPPMLHARVAYPTETIHNENDLFVDKTK